MKISDHEWKTGKGGRVGDVQHSHIPVRMYIRNEWEYLSHIVIPSPPWSIKRGRGPLAEGLPIFELLGHTNFV